MLQNRSHGGGTGKENDLRLDQIELSVQILPACGSFLVGRGAVSRRPTFHDVTDINVFIFINVHRSEDFVEELTGFADERKTCLIFILTRSFSDDHQSGFGVAAKEHDTLACLAQSAGFALAGVLVEFFERVEGCFHRSLFLAQRSVQGKVYAKHVLALSVVVILI